MNDTLLVAAFFDNPNLLAVRFAQSGARSRVAAFATSRPPDAVPGGCVAIGATILIGMAVVGVGFGMLSQCSGSGSTGRALPVIAEAVTADCQKSSAWNSSLATLGDDLAPREALKPWYVRTLLDVPRELARSGDASGGWLKPRCSSADLAAYRQGMQLAALLADTGASRDVAVILDLPGPLAVAAATGMSSYFEPVFTLDNLPHPSGVVPSEQTLAAVVHWRPELVQSRSGRSPQASPLFILEGGRLNPYGNELERFDNRSGARLPDVAGFKTLGATRILYVRQQRGQVAEADDLNQLFAACAEAGLEVKHLALESLDPPASTPPPAIAAERPPAGSQMWFWQNYGWGRPTTQVFAPAFDPDAGYRSTLRPTPPVASGITSPLDGGQRHHTEVINRLSRPAPSPSPSPSSGGSWGRSSTSSSG